LNAWLSVAESKIVRVRPAAYIAAGEYLRKAKTIWERQKRIEEWNALLGRLRLQNKRRPRMIEVLDAL